MDFHSNRGYPRSVGIHPPDGAYLVTVYCTVSPSSTSFVIYGVVRSRSIETLDTSWAPLLCRPSGEARYSSTSIDGCEDGDASMAWSH